MINSIQNLLDVVNLYYQILDDRIDFDSDGWPIFEKKHFLTEWPSDVVTFDNRNSRLVKHPKDEVLLCHFAGDKQNYRRLEKVQYDIEIYRMYMGVVIPDVTVTREMDIEFQELIIQVNQLYAAVVASQGIKIVFNTRIGYGSSDRSFCRIPRNIMCASGFLGCKSNARSANMYVNKILGLVPDKLIIYGKCDPLVNAQLDVLGISYRYYDDFHRRSKRRAA